MAEAEEQAPVSPQSEGRSGAGEEAPERAPESGAALGTGEPATSPAGSPGTEEPAGDAKKKSNAGGGPAVAGGRGVGRRGDRREREPISGESGAGGTSAHADGRERGPISGESGGVLRSVRAGRAASPLTAVPFPVDILLKAVGDTPIMKTKKWAVERTRTIQGLCDFIKKFLKLVASEQLVRRFCPALSGSEWGLSQQ
ncbi:UNVERIFIED_CONTAM: hypothetical protein H355_015280 [Colinus virginianus]|nr:hypothetical protein H355_015280 [Colinus virginianus]